jgi:anti-sigma regulatory factor (Ser/Thr protein kinase)
LSTQAAAGGGIRHVALLCRTPAEYHAGLSEFVQEGASAGEPVLVAVPSGRLPPGWNLAAGMSGARGLDVADLGRNPSRLMPAIRAFADEHPGQHVRVVCELAWPGRSPPELGEVAIYEAMVNQAFAAIPVAMLCPYDTAGLPRAAISAAYASHPWLRQGGRERGSGEYRSGPDSRGRPTLPLPVPPDVRSLSYHNDLRQVRALVAAEADRAGLSGPRRTDLVIAASEVAANTLKHTGRAGLVRVWVTGDEILCQFDDSGHIEDPLAGYGRTAEDEPGGHGLWLVNQVCDLAEIHTSTLGTTIRLHMFRKLPQTSPLDQQRVG